MTVSTVRQPLQLAAGHAVQQARGPTQSGKALLKHRSKLCDFIWSLCCSSGERDVQQASNKHKTLVTVTTRRLKFKL